MQASSQHTSVLPVISLLLSASLWGLFWIPLRWLELQGLAGVWITFLIYCGTLVYAIPILALHYRSLVRQPWLLVLIGLSSGWTNIAFILAVLEGEVVRIVLLFYLSPIWATLLARLVLKEHMTIKSYWLLLMAIAGAMLMLWSPKTGYPWPQSRADWYGLSSGFGFALMNLCVHMTREVDIKTKTASAWVGVFLVAGVAVFMRSENIGSVEPLTVLYALLIGMTLIGAMTWLVVYGMTHVPVHRSAVILLFEIVVATVSTYALTMERLSTREWLGGLAVVLAAYLSARQQKSQPSSGGNYA